jgi:Protein of unknown function (DUF3108)
MPPGGFRSVTSRVASFVIRLAVALSLLLLDAGVSLAGAQAKLDAAYTATLFGLPIGHISWTVELRNNRFITAATGGISGLLRIFSDGHGDVSAQGSLSGGEPIASNFALTLIAGRWSDEVRILFRGNKAQEFVAAAPPPSSNQVPITDAHRTGVVDPMTALLVHVPGTGKTAVPEACERTIPIFDGHTRYNLRLSFKRIDHVDAESGYQGPVVVCSVKFFPLAGYDPSHFLVTYLAAQRDIEIWLAPLAGSRLMVPYRMSMPTPMGLGVLQATKFESVPPKSLTTNLN